MTTATYSVNGLTSAMAMAKAIERLALLPGVTQVTVHLPVQLAHEKRSVLLLRTTAIVPAAQVSACLRAVGARLANPAPRDAGGLQQTFTRSA